MMLLCCWLIGCTREVAQSRVAQEAWSLPLKIMSFNIRYGTAKDGVNAWEHRRPPVRQMIASHSPDVIGLQEALRFQIDELRAMFPAYGEVGVGRDDGETKGEYAAILYLKDRFTPMEHGTFWLSDTPEVPGSKSWGNRITRICTWVRLADSSASGRAVWVFNVHLDHESEESRRKSVELVAGRVLGRADAAEPVVVMGDFNCGEGSRSVRFMVGEIHAAVEGSGGVGNWTGMIDTFRIANPDRADVGTFHAFKGGTAGDRIDYIFVDKGARVLNADIDRGSLDGRFPSDHYAVTTSVRFGR